METKKNIQVKDTVGLVRKLLDIAHEEAESNPAKKYEIAVLMKLKQETKVYTSLMRVLSTDEELFNRVLEKIDREDDTQLIISAVEQFKSDSAKEE